MKVFLTREDKVINMPPDELPEFYIENRWQLIFSASRNMHVTAPPSPSADGVPQAPVE